MPLDDTNMPQGGGGGGPPDPSRLLAAILFLMKPARPDFTPLGVENMETVHFTITTRVSPDGTMFQPLILAVERWEQIEFEDPENDSTPVPKDGG